MCYKHYPALLSHMRKRTVTVRHRFQTNLKDPRLAYFQVRVEMGPDFDSNIFKKFVRFFDGLKDDEYWLSAAFGQLSVGASKSSRRLQLVNVAALRQASHLNIEFIKQNLAAPLSISFF